MKHRVRSKRVEVKDNWYPCYENNEIIVSIHWAHFECDDEHVVVISAHGADDFGVELRHVTKYEASAKSVFEFWTEHIYNKIPDGITVQWFYEHGFLPS